MSPEKYVQYSSVAELSETYVPGMIRYTYKYENKYLSIRTCTYVKQVRDKSGGFPAGSSKNKNEAERFTERTPKSGRLPRVRHEQLQAGRR